ncbi:putative surface protein with fasciclin (FAS1) repeats [Actimicrobium sp. GrIS 1.19]|uniref:fasciclin domain-containing protein n=1 Tax=Actimicrobium sp. GrIS 1.19 TaxID=3071708 RepID=UPI002E0B3A89|nr:putative surface protein with fasciclin (FAS1) repeats [Actimicrobium sp. GrIS 1.19]
MPFRSLPPALVALLFAVSASTAGAANLVDTANSAGTFRTFLASAKAAGLTDSLQNQGPFTIFAPSDAAFAKLPPGTVNALLKDKVRLAQLITHHIIPGKILVSEVKPGPVKTIQGDLVTLTSDNGKITVDGANVTQSDLTADNGVIQVIDTVIMPK